MRKLIASIAAVFAATTAFAAAPATIPGPWSFHSIVAGQESDMICTFTQIDTKLGGNCKLNDKDIVITGTVDGVKLTWVVKSELNGAPLTLTYSGKLENDALTGSIDVQPYGMTGDFTGTQTAPAK